MAAETDLNENDVITIDIWGAIRKHFVLAIVVCAVTIAGMCVYTFTRTPQYTATAQLLATYRGAASDTTASSYNAGASYIQSQIQTYPELVKTESVLKPVIDDLGLDTTVNALAQTVTASNPSDTMLLSVSVVDSNPKSASDIANSVAENLSKQVSSKLYNENGDELVSPINLAVVQQAYTPASPSSPNVKMNLAIGVLGGLVLGIIVAIIRDLVDRRVRQSVDACAIVDAPLFGSLTRDDSAYDAKSPVIIARPNSVSAEDVRRLRTNLSFADTENDVLGNVIIVTSSGPEEGKTTVSLNLATAFAETGSKVLLIDTDIRKPSVSERLGVDGTIGLTHLISGQVSSHEAIQRYWKPGFHVLPVGERSLNPSLLVNSAAMRSLLAQVSKNYDHVIVDTTPMCVSNDAAVLAKEGAELLMVVGLGTTEKKILRKTVQELRTLGLHITGLVVNFAEQEHTKGELYEYYDSPSNDRGRHKKLNAENNKQ